jgi:flagellar basal-body rod protein FlgB
MKASSVTDLLFKQLNFRGEKQKVISTNIANIDTIGFRTKQLDFKEQLKRSSLQNDLKLSVTNPGHMRIDEVSKPVSFKITETKGLTEQNDGNNVNLDDQMSKMSQNNIMFSAIQSSIKKDALWFKSIISESSKN